MNQEQRQKLQEKLVGIKGVSNGVIPNILNAINKSNSVEEMKIALVGMKNVNTIIIPNIVSTVKTVGVSFGKIKEIKEVEEIKETKQDDREVIIFNAVKQLIENNNEEDLTSSGVPKLEALERVTNLERDTGKKITVMDRTKAMEKYQS